MKTEIEVKITPSVMAEEFWKLCTVGQAEFFAALSDVITEDNKTNSSAYSFGELQWSHLRYELDKPENRKAKIMHMALSTFAFDYLPQKLA
jgi:hypothetical protein